ISILLSVCQNLGNQVGGFRSLGAARGWTKLAQAGCKLPELRGILRLGLMKGADLADHGHLTSALHLGVHLGHGNRQDDQDDRDNDQKLNEGEASAAGPLCFQVITHTYSLRRGSSRWRGG